MKIGTLTFHRACNNGAVLQAYALERAFNQIDGVKAEIIDYRCEKIDYAYTPFFCFYNCMQIASQNGHLCHIRRPLCDLNGGHPRTH